MIIEKFRNIFEFASKSNLKADNGVEKGIFPFYTSSSVLSKRIGKAQYFEESLIIGTGGSANIHYSNEPFSTSSDCIVATSRKNNINIKYIYYYFIGNMYVLERIFKGAGLKHVSKNDIENIDIPIVDINSQNRIVAILDNVVSLIQKRNQVIQLLDELLEAVFLDLFGDPIINLKKWPIENIQKITQIIKDGPFGSELKTNHYVDKGVRVIRLQNIGVNSFNDSDKVYISEGHYKRLEKHTCIHGDILVGTLGVPNLRACKFPKHMDKAINKADCIQIRPNLKKVHDSYLTFLLNMPSSLYLLSPYIKGQTRTRISKDVLCKLDIPVPPMKIQKKFFEFEIIIEKIKSYYVSGNIDILFRSILLSAFNGKMIFDIDFELDILINDIDLQTNKNNLSEIVNNNNFLQKLIEKLSKHEFIDRSLYDKAKHGVFQLLKEGKVVQEYDSKTKSVRLILK